MKKPETILLTLLTLALACGIYIHFAKDASEPTANADRPRASGKAKARSSKALKALLNPSTNVEAPLEDSAIVALTLDERQRREKQEALLTEPMRTKFDPLFRTLEELAKGIDENASAAKLAEIEAVSVKTLEAMDSAVDEVMEDPAAASLTEKIEEQLETFRTASTDDRDAMLPTLKANLEKLLTQVATRATQRLTR